MAFDLELRIRLTHLAGQGLQLGEDGVGVDFLLFLALVAEAEVLGLAGGLERGAELGGDALGSCLHAARNQPEPAGDYATARDWQDRLIGLHKALFLDNSPAPTKYALSRLQLCSEDIRLPLSLTSDAVKPAIDRAMADAGLG